MVDWFRYTHPAGQQLSTSQHTPLTCGQHVSLPQHVFPSPQHPPSEQHTPPVTGQHLQNGNVNPLDFQGHQCYSTSPIGTGCRASCSIGERVQFTESHDGTTIPSGGGKSSGQGWKRDKTNKEKTRGKHALGAVWIVLVRSDVRDVRLYRTER